MEPLNLHSELLTKFSNNIWILKHYGCYQDCRMLMTILCHQTNQIWQEYKQAYRKELHKSLKNAFYGFKFKEMHKNFLLEKNRYKYYKIYTYLFGQDSDCLISFLREVGQPELLDISDYGNNSLGYKLFNFIDESIEIGKEWELNKDSIKLNDTYQIDKLKSRIFAKEYIKELLNGKSGDFPRIPFTLCHSSLTYSYALKYYEVFNEQPMNYAAFLEFKEFTLSEVRLESSSQIEQLSNGIDFLCKSFPKLLQFNIELNGFQEESLKGIGSFIKNKHANESLQFDLRTTRDYKNCTWVKSKNTTFIYFSHDEPLFFRGDAVKLSFWNCEKKEETKNEKFIIISEKTDFKLKNFTLWPNNNLFVRRILDNFEETVGNCIAVEKKGWTSMKFYNFSNLPPFPFDQLQKLKIEYDGGLSKSYSKIFNFLIDEKSRADDPNFTGPIPKDTRIFLKFSDIIAWPCIKPDDFGQLNDRKIYRFEIQSKYITETFESFDIHIKPTRVLMKDIVIGMLRNPHLNSILYEDSEFNLATDDDRKELRLKKNKNIPILELIAKCEDIGALRKPVDDGFIKY